MSPRSHRAPPVTARAWCRVDLAGGTLDIWPLGLIFPGAATVNVAIDLAVEVSLETADAYSVETAAGSWRAGDTAGLLAQRETALFGVIAAALDLPPVALRAVSASPLGAGLGASSALTVATIAAGDRLTGRPPRPPRETVHLARDLEARLMELPTGVQDHYPALLGGALHLVYGPGGERVERLAVDLEELSGHLVVAYSGRSHFSAATNWLIIRHCLEAEPRTRERFAAIAAAAAEVAAACRSGDWEAVGRAVGEEWEARRGLAEGVTVEVVDRLLAAAAAAGAWGGKACGAGGGGCVAVLVPAARRDEVLAALRREGAEVLPVAATERALELEGG